MFGAVGLGRLIKYMPYPVVSGYLSGVGLIIIISQMPKFLGVPKGTLVLGRRWSRPSLWQWQGVAVGAVTVAVMVAAPKLTKAVPAAILGLAAGVLAYFGLGLADRPLLELSREPARGRAASAVRTQGFLDGDRRHAGTASAAWSSSASRLLVMPALTLAVLLSIDTLKTCVVLDALTRSATTRTAS